MRVTKLKSEKINGRTVIFERHPNNPTFKVWAKIPELSSQWIGTGRTKEEAREEVKEMLRKYEKVGKKNKKINIILNSFVK